MDLLTSLRFLIVITLCYTFSVSAKPFLEQAEEARINRDVDQAIKLYQKHLKDNPSSVDARVGLMRCYFNKGYTDRVNIQINYLLKQDANNPYAMLFKGKIYLKNKEWSEARDILEVVVNSNPQITEAYLPLSSAYSNLGEHESAELIYKKRHEIAN